MTDSTPLVDRNCTRAGRDARALTAAERAELVPQTPDWRIDDSSGIARLERVFMFKNFVEALSFTNAVGAMAEAQDHHPALITEWGRVTVQWWTHTVKGLHLNDFIAAAKTDRLYTER